MINDMIILKRFLFMFFYCDKFFEDFGDHEICPGKG